MNMRQTKVLDVVIVVVLLLGLGIALGYGIKSCEAAVKPYHAKEVYEATEDDGTPAALAADDDADEVPLTKFAGSQPAESDMGNPLYQCQCTSHPPLPCPCPGKEQRDEGLDDLSRRLKEREREREKVRALMEVDTE